MLEIDIVLDGNNAWPDLQDRGVHEVQKLAITALDRGMASGKPSVAIRLDLEDGTVVVAQTSLVLFLSAADALKARYGDPRH